MTDMCRALPSSEFKPDEDYKAKFCENEAGWEDCPRYDAALRAFASGFPAMDDDDQPT